MKLIQIENFRSFGHKFMLPVALFFAGWMGVLGSCLAQESGQIWIDHVVNSPDCTGDPTVYVCTIGDDANEAELTCVGYIDDDTLEWFEAAAMGAGVNTFYATASERNLQSNPYYVTSNGGNGSPILTVTLATYACPNPVDPNPNITPWNSGASVGFTITFSFCCLGQDGKYSWGEVWPATSQQGGCMNINGFGIDIGYDETHSFNVSGGIGTAPNDYHYESVPQVAGCAMGGTQNVTLGRWAGGQYNYYSPAGQWADTTTWTWRNPDANNAAQNVSVGCTAWSTSGAGTVLIVKGPQSYGCP
jgi:hypothetical protein